MRNIYAQLLLKYVWWLLESVKEERDISRWNTENMYYMTMEVFKM
jgi:hypothetical protein